MADFHVADYSPWEGWEVSGLADDDHPARQGARPQRRAAGRPGDGEWLPRKIEAPILERVAL